MHLVMLIKCVRRLQQEDINVDGDISIIPNQTILCEINVWNWEE